MNVDPSGEAVIAGRAAPNEKVELRDAGKTVAEATADASGQFVIIPPALTPGDHSLSLAANTDKGEPAVSSPVAVSVPAPEVKTGVAAGPPEAKPTVAVAIPANSKTEPSALGMRTLATPAPVSGARVAIQSVEADAPGGLVAKGSAQPNTTLRLYLNQADLAEAKTQSDGRWSLTIKGGMSPGDYVIQADEINPSGATVVASANTPFDYPDMPAAPALQAAAAPASAEPSSAPSPSDPVVASVQTKRVGDWAHIMGSQPKLLRRPDALPGDRQREPGADPQPQSHLSRRGVRRPEIGLETIVRAPMPSDRRDETLPELRHRTFDDALGRRIVDTHIWAVREGLRGADAYSPI